MELIMTINPFLAAFFAPFFIAIGVTVWRLAWSDTVDAYERCCKVPRWREFFVGMGVVFLGGSYMYYLPSYPGPAIFYVALGGGMILVVMVAYLSARYSLRNRP